MAKCGPHNSVAGARPGDKHGLLPPTEGICLQAPRFSSHFKTNIFKLNTVNILE